MVAKNTAQSEQPAKELRLSNDDREVRYSDDPRDIGWVRENVPCQTACPAETNIPSYIRAIFEERYSDAYETNFDANVLPGTLGRICSRPCETACRHALPGNGETVSICHLKRVSGDEKSGSQRMSQSLFTATGKKIAIIGSGPAGITAARDLSMLGHDITIFEREEKAGGMLEYGIPEFRLPRDVLTTEIHNALRLGVNLKKGVNVGTGKDDVKVSELLKKYDAVLLATGCMVASQLPLRREESDDDPVRIIKDAEYGLDFLVDLHRGEKKTVGKRVAVLGAGFTAMDCSRVAYRLGAKEVTIHLRTTEEYISVTKEEVFETKKESVKMRGLRTPIDIITDDKGKLTGVKFIQNRLGGWREDGRRKAIPIEGSEFIEPCDTLLVAIGQKTVNDYIDVKVDLERWGNVKINAKGMTSVDGLFAAGDFVLGASTVIDAIGHAHDIGERMDEWLMGKKRRKQVVKMVPVDEPLRERAYDFIPLQHMPTIPLKDRFNDLTTEVETGLTEDKTIEEAKRCYLCDLKYEIDVDNCIYCRACIEVAPRDCIKLVEGVDINDDGTYGDLIETEDWSKAGAIWIDNDECIRCGACLMVCPTECITITRHELVTVDVEQELSNGKTTPSCGHRKRSNG